MGWEWINKIAIELRKRYLTNSPYDLCEILEIRIERVDHNYFLLENKISTYFRNFYGEQIIFIRNDLYGIDEEFTLRHEIGHALLHPDISCSAYTNTGKIDKQADYFALVLMGITFDLIEVQDMTLRQFASCIEVPFEPLSQLVYL